ncbi:MAG: hypothetical protein DHS20C15_30840 [Planctomycetota bacterium]|nr:MAG: hypothetical protein DHS20C15_30840 [Planctomycetota bacterium]
MRCITLTLAASALFATSAAAGDVVRINEVDADTTGTDIEEFFELTGTPNASLDDYFIVLYNGSDSSPVDEEYNIIDLDDQTMPADGFFVVSGSATVANVDFNPSAFDGDNDIQNGADAIALWFDTTGLLVAADFDGTTPSTAPAGAVLRDALVYDTSDSDDAVLLASLSITGPQVNENENGAKDTESNGRCPDGGTGLNTNNYVTAAPTPGLPNTCPTPAWVDVGSGLAGVFGVPTLSATGDLSDGDTGIVTLVNAAPSAVAAAFISVGAVTPTGFKGGTIVPIPLFKLAFAATNPSGGIQLSFTMPSGVVAGVEVHVQWAIQDVTAVSGVALSNAIKGTTP